MLDAPPGISLPAPLAYFDYPEVAEVQAKLFGVAFRTRAVTNQIQSIKERLKDELYRFIERFQLEVLVPENILAIPTHVPLGLAMTEVIAQTALPVIAHHHDFAWERERFTLNAVNDYLQAAFPPLLYGMEHVVINSFRAKSHTARHDPFPGMIGKTHSATALAREAACGVTRCSSPPPSISSTRWPPPKPWDGSSPNSSTT